MRSRWGSTPDPKAGEAALTGEGTLLLIIAGAVMILCGWLALRGAEATDEQARAYAERTLHQLLLAHDAAYFAANLSPRARGQYPPSQQRYIISSLTNLGIPSSPVKVEGDISYGSDPGAQDPTGRFQASVVYPTVEARFYIDVARRQGLGRIDYFSASSNNRPDSGGIASP